MDILTLSVIEETASAVAGGADATHAAFKFSPEGLMETLPIMGKGMLGIFIVIAIIIICVSLLNNLTSPDRNKKQVEKRMAKTEKRAEKLKSKNEDK